jgi:glycosyltransferase involved in cell wall biosynthesis
MARKRKTWSVASRVAVIVPVHGRAPYLAEALASIGGQEPPPDEVVVVDDCSPEPLRLDGVRVLRREERGGPAGARQAGLEATAAELVALCDADDAWEPGKLVAQLGALERNPEAALCFGGVTVVGQDGRPTGERWRGLVPGLHEPERLRDQLFEWNPIPTSSALIRREALEHAGGFASPVPYGVEDWDLWLRLVAQGERFHYEPRAGIRYRRHAGGLTADVARIGELGLAVHERHAELVDEDVRRRVRARDLTTVARGRVRGRRYAEARALLREAADLEPPAPRERLLRPLLAVPGARAVLGRRSPWR